MRGLTALTDVLYICHGESGRAVDAIAEAVTRRLGEEGQKSLHVEGRGAQQWVLIDLGDLMVHGSPPNMSPWHRRIYSLILNPVANAYTKETRADHQHHRDLTPVAPLGDDCLLSGAAA